MGVKFTSDGRIVGSVSSETWAEDMQKFKAISEQVGGTHYKSMAIQPAEYILANGIGWSEGDAITYLSRWRSKGGIEDLRKAIHHIQMLIDHEMKEKKCT